MAEFIELSKSFGTVSEPVAALYQAPGLGYYVPLYQREYSWDKDNIAQLMEDICRGIRRLSDGDLSTIHFLGVAIFLQEQEPERNIQPQDPRALPRPIDNVIDGQQRLATLSLLATALYQEIYENYRRLSKGFKTEHDLSEAVLATLETLQEMFSVNLKRGTPHRKPIIIRGAIDAWTLDGDDDKHYKSDLANYTARFIRAIDGKSHNFQKLEFPKPPAKSTRVGRNLGQLRSLLKKVREAHKEQDLDPMVPTAPELLKGLGHANIWQYERAELEELINDTRDSSRDRDRLHRLIQLSAFCHFLFTRCCFTLVRPTKATWAFDMFQSLNATGAPLTALEVFKPYVVNIYQEHFKNSKHEGHFRKADELLDVKSTFAKKSRLTDEFLTLLRLVDDGKKLTKQFSVQRQWLLEAFDRELESLPKDQNREQFISQLGDVSQFWRDVVRYDPSQAPSIAGIAGAEEASLATLCCMYLESAGHPMARAVLASVYRRVLSGEAKSKADFVGTAKAVAAFFTLWRAARSNRGLDNVYRLYMQEQAARLAAGDNDLATLQSCFRKALGELWKEEKWLRAAARGLRYDTVREVCRFVIHLTAADCIVDSASTGLMKEGKPGSAPGFLVPEAWKSTDFKDIEHVAPRAGAESGWDPELYQDDELYHSLGNLTLLPTAINISAGNRGWTAKHLYYRFLAETDPSRVSALREEAASENVALNGSTVDLLMATSTKRHMAPIVALGVDGDWNASLVERRTRRMLKIAWDRLQPWLS